MAQTTVTSVPNARVPALKRLFERTSATRVDVLDNGDGTSNVTATFPDQTTHTDFKAQTAAAKPPSP
jgi:hypothetical protein